MCRCNSSWEIRLSTEHPQLSPSGSMYHCKVHAIVKKALRLRLIFIHDNAIFCKHIFSAISMLILFILKVMDDDETVNFTLWYRKTLPVSYQQVF